jgi:N-acyl-D-aspartate/D-glutamate deacylase
MFDLKIVGGTIVDGTGADRFTGDIGVRDGKIVAVKRGGGLEGEAAETIDATGKVVAPGFVDVHTHYDGQATWDEVLEPSSQHGVTTIVAGNCGVGFAPVRPGSEDWLISLMEGVEDIPGTALHEGMTWGWESFPEYLDVLDTKKWSIDIGTQVAHGAVRAYVMGDRGAKNDPATADDIEAMARIVRESIEAGALGVSTSRVLGHRAMDGEPVPGTFAAEDELFGIGRAIVAGGGGVFELAPAGADGQDLIRAPKEVDWMGRLSKEAGLPVSFALLEVRAEPELWRELMEESIKAIDNGARLFPQIAIRPFGMLIGFASNHPFAKRPTFKDLADRLPYDELVVELAKPVVRDAILGEADLPPDPTIQFDSLPGSLQHMASWLYVLGDKPDYEPTNEMTLENQAKAAGLDPMSYAYDLMLRNQGQSYLIAPFFNYAYENHDVIREMMLHPAGVSGLSDGGAHCRMICDASYPTYLLTHWARDRKRGEGLPLEFVIKKQTHDTAQLYGLTDRGVIAEGKKADLNVIDHERITLHHPRSANDLPAGGRRLLQDASGYEATIVSGAVTRRNGKDTGARPGRLVRGTR